jgi:hypothetical protein
MLIPLLIVLSIGAGLLRGGSLRNFAALPLRWIPLIIASFVLQLFLFTPFLHRPLIDIAVEPLYVLSMLMAAIWVALNWRISGMPLIALGLGSNLAAIVANGGRMPISPENALYTGEIANFSGGSTVANNSLLAAPEQVHLWLLTDIVPLPKGIPFSGVFSIGDVVLVAGIMYLCYRTARSTSASARPPLPNSPSAG